jgi:hypothetical protein
MISSEYHLKLAKADLAKWRGMLGELEGVLTKLPRAISAQVGAHRAATIRQQIRELETEIQQYEARKRRVGMQLVHG